MKDIILMVTFIKMDLKILTKKRGGQHGMILIHQVYTMEKKGISTEWSNSLVAKIRLRNKVNQV